MSGAPYVPIERECPKCGTTAWGLKVDGGPMFGTPTRWTAACYPKGHERPVRLLLCPSVTLAFGPCVRPEGHKGDCQNHQGETWNWETL